MLMCWLMRCGAMPPTHLNLRLRCRVIVASPARVREGACQWVDPPESHSWWLCRMDPGGWIFFLCFSISSKDNAGSPSPL